MEDVEFNKKKKIKPLLLIFTIILGLGITLSAIYFMYYYKDTRNNTLNSGLVSIQFQDSGAISINSNVPVIDDVGLLGTPYEFTIKNTSSVPIDVNIKLNIKPTTTFTTNEYGAVRYGLYINNELVKKDYINPDNLTLYTQENLAKNVTISCKLYVWVDYYYETPGKIFAANIVAEGKSRDMIPVTLTLNPNYETETPTTTVIDANSTTYGTLPEPIRDDYTFTGWFTTADDTGTEVTSTTPFTYGISQTTLYAHWEETASGPLSEMCPNCRFMFTTNNYAYNEDGISGAVLDDIINDNNVLVSTNYEDIISASGHPVFLGVITSNGATSGKITRAFACGVEPDSETPFCIEGYTDDSKQSQNFTFMIPIFGEENCNEENEICESASVSMMARSTSNGSAIVYMDDGFLSCGVNSGGRFDCVE